MNELQEDVLRAIADDYEEIGQILMDVRGWHPSRTIREEDVVFALEGLINSALARAFELSTTGPAKVAEFEPARAKELYFYITSEGKQALSS